MDAERLLEGLDAEQRLAVASPSLLLAVIAGAGSGKTSVLTRRIAYRVAIDSADARHIAAVTFTRQAAGELRRRLSRLGVRDQVIAGTFHATALTMLRQHWDDTRRSAPSITSDRRRILAAALGADIRSERVREAAMEIDWARARGLSAQTYAESATSFGRRPSMGAAAVGDAMERYETEKRRRGVVDLDDLLSMALELMRENTSFAAAVRWRMRHVFVDEAQDLNPLQAALLDEWRRGRDDLTLVGDPQQSIYGFNGADPTLLVAPEERFPGIEVIALTTNYRCTPQIVSAGVRVLAENGVDARSRSARDDGRPVEVHGYVDEAAEAAGIARLVRERRPPGGAWRSVAVLARTNAQLLPIAEELTRAGIPHRLSAAARASTPIERALREAAESTSAHRLATWAADAAQAHADETGLPTEDVTALARVAAAVEEFLSVGGGDGSAFLSWVRTNDPLRDIDTSVDAVELLTFHAAKGREWSHIVVAGACAGLVPHSSAVTDRELAEEWRLFYVALTRASETIAITYPQRRAGRPTAPPAVLGALISDEIPISRPPQGLLPPSTTQDPLLASLVAWRARAARAADMDLTHLVTDEMLTAVADSRPHSIDELAALPGFGPMMARRFGTRILAVVDDAQSDPGTRR